MERNTRKPFWKNSLKTDGQSFRIMWPSVVPNSPFFFFFSKIACQVLNHLNNPSCRCIASHEWLMESVVLNFTVFNYGIYHRKYQISQQVILNRQVEKCQHNLLAPCKWKVLVSVECREINLLPRLLFLKRTRGQLNCLAPFNKGLIKSSFVCLNFPA